MLVGDLVGFTARSDLADPEDARAALRPFHAVAKREIERLRRTVEKFIGDDIVAVFGAPVAHEDDPERAVRAALAIRDWLTRGGRRPARADRREYGRGARLARLPPARERGDRRGRRRQYGRSGCRPRRPSMASWSASRPIGRRGTQSSTARAPVEAKGESEPIPAWEALEARSPLGVECPPRAAAPLVGRQRELDSSRRRFARVRAERSPQLVTLVGVPGIGKSRLVFELFRIVEPGSRARSRGVRAARLPYGDGVSFWALGEVVKAQVGILEIGHVRSRPRRSCAVQSPSSSARPTRPLGRDAAAAAHRRRRRDAGRSSCAERRSPPGAASSRRSPTSARSCSSSRTCTGRTKACSTSSTSSSIAFASAAAGLCTARPELLERRPGWGGGKANALTISLPPLSDDETAGSSPRCSSSRGSRPTCTRRCSRGPAATRSTRSSSRACCPSRPARGAAGDRHGIIAARLDGLAAGREGLLQDAAVVGKVFWLGALEAIGDASPGRRRSCCRPRAEGVRAARRAAPRSRARPSTPSATSCFATSPTARSRGRAAAKGIAARPTGSSRSAAPKITPRCSRTTT